MIVDAVGGGDIEMVADFAEGGRIAMLFDGVDDEVVDHLLAFGEFFAGDGLWVVGHGDVLWLAVFSSANV